MLEAGISVLTTIGLEVHRRAAGLRPPGRRPGAAPRAVPQEFVSRADELVVVDAPPEAGAGGDAADELNALRQRALLLAAEVVDRQLEAYLRRHGIESSWAAQERILVCMTPRANAARMLAAARRAVDHFHGELFATYVVQEHLTEEDRSANERNATLARAQEARLDILEGHDPAAAILDHARRLGITQIFVGHSLRARLDGGAPPDAARAAHPRRRGDRRSDLPAVTAMAQTTPRRGRLKVFLGYAAGVGKTYQMLSEAHRAVREGVDLVVGYVEAHGRRDTIALVAGLECVPRTAIEVPRRAVRGDGRRGDRPAPAAGRGRRRAPPHQRARIAADQALGGRARTCSTRASTSGRR